MPSVNAQDKLMSYNFKSAVIDNNAEEVERLLRHGTDPNIRDDQGFSALDLASINGYAQIARLLIKSGAKVNRDDGGYTPLMGLAAGSGDIETARLLIDNGAEINARTNDGWTALMYGVYSFDNTAVVRLLLDKRADRHVRNRDGNTALSIAERFNTPEMTLLLKEASAQDYSAIAAHKQQRLNAARKPVTFRRLKP